MSLAATVKAMAAAGCSVEQIASVVERMEMARLDRVREGNRKRQASYRQRNANNALPDVTSRDERDLAPPSSSPLSSPPTPPPIIPLSPSPPTSLRSDLSRPTAEAFARFWAVYPRKVERKAAETKFSAAVRGGVDPEWIIAGARRYADSRPDPKYTKHPTTWLNGGCWDDEAMPRAGPKPGSAMAEMAFPGLRDLHDDQRSSEHYPGEVASNPNSGASGFAGRVSESDRDDASGTLLDL